MSVILQAPPAVSGGDVTDEELDAAIADEAAARDAALAAHEADTTSVHGISNTNALVLNNDARLTDARTPVAHDASLVTSGTFDDARIPSSVARDSEVSAAVAAEATARDLAIATAVAALINGAPGALDTLDELAAAFGDDANFVTTVTNALATKVSTTTTVNGHALSGNVVVTASDVGLGNVDNTSDANKPVSTATQTALNLKANIANPTFTGTVTIPTGASITAPTGLVKGDVGLGNVDNTSDATKNAASVTLTNKTLTSPVLNTGVSGTAIDTDATMAANSDTILASQKATKTALALKANLASPSFTGTVTIGSPTDTPTQSLNVSGSVYATGAPFGGLTFIGTEYGGPSCIDLRRANGSSIAANTPIQSGDALAGWHVGGSDGVAGVLRDVSKIYCYATETWDDSPPHYGTEWRFYTHPNNTAQVSGGELAMTIGQGKTLTVVGSIIAGATGTFLGSSGVGLNLERDKGSALATNDVIASLSYFGSNDAVGTLKNGGVVRVLADGTWDSTHWPGRIEFLTAPNSAAGATVRGGFSAAGTFYIGTTLAAANASITSAGAFGFNGQTAAVKSGWATPSAGTDRTALTTGDTAAVVLNTLATLITDLLSVGVITA